MGDTAQQFVERLLSGFYRHISFEINSAMNDKTCSLPTNKGILISRFSSGAPG
jgi:hypothetical protein